MTLPKGYINQDFSISSRMPDMMGDLDYAEELAGSDGMHFHFFAPPGTPLSVIQNAAQRAADTRDLVSWSYSYDSRATVLQKTPESKPKVIIHGNGTQEQEPAIISTCRRVKSESQAKRFYWTHESKRRSLMVDSFSAGMVLAIWDALKPEQRAKLILKDQGCGVVILDICMKLYGKCAK